MMDQVTPTPEQEQRAKWDLLLLDLEQRTEQVRQLKGVDADFRLEQLRQLKALDADLKLEQLRMLKVHEPRRLMLMGMTTGATVFGAGAAACAIAFKALGWLP